MWTLGSARHKRTKEYPWGVRSAVVLIAVVLTASAIGICWSDSAEADPCVVHFDYQPRGDCYMPATIGKPILRENIQFLIDMGSWHLENGDPWDPDAPITGDMLIIIDERPEPIPTPVVPVPTPTPEITPGPAPTPSPQDSNQNVGTNDLKKYAPFALLIGGLIIATGLIFLSKK